MNRQGDTVGWLETRFELALPDWLGPFLAAWDEPLECPVARMNLAV